MIFVDDRTPEQKTRLTIIVMMTDKVLSFWGQAGDGPSFAGWACTPENADQVEKWVRNRSDAECVRRVTDYKRTGKGHTHIYAADEGHPSLQ